MLRRAFSSLRHFKVHEEVQHALQRGQPVVALESTIISHGMPFPANLETAKSVEHIVRQEGAIPATIAILQGTVHIGLDNDALAYLAEQGQRVNKVSRRDLAAVVGWQMDGATTVSSTMYLAHQAGIKLFVTGGIGGVHRGAESSFDISADLTELGRTPVAVVCAGVKSILDIGKTLEYLETQGVPVISVGSSPQFPAFFIRDSGFKVSSVRMILKVISLFL
jgi:pseudouridine-5'-phosphate glycosidase